MKLKEKLKKGILIMLLCSCILPIGNSFAYDGTISPMNIIPSTSFDGKVNKNSAKEYLKGIHYLKVSNSKPSFHIWVNEYHSGPNNDIIMTRKFTSNISTNSGEFEARGYNYYIRYEGHSDYAFAVGRITH